MCGLVFPVVAVPSGPGRPVIELVRIAVRGYVIVGLVSANTVFLSRGIAAAACACSFCLALVWWGNAKTAARVDRPIAAVCYATGSAFGTVSGLLAAGWFG